MKRIKIIFVSLVLSIIILGFLFISILQYVQETNSGVVNSFEDFIVRHYRYLSFIPVILGIWGLFKRTIIGWICVACIFYLMTFMGIVAGTKNDFTSFYELWTYSLFMITIVSPLIIINMKDFKNQYNADFKRILWVENLVAAISMVILGIGLTVLNA